MHDQISNGWAIDLYLSGHISNSQCSNSQCARDEISAIAARFVVDTGIVRGEPE
jgi:hypothetical protein